MPRRTSSVPALLVTTLILVPGARHLVAQEGVPPAPPEVIRQVDSIFSRWDSQALPGCAVGVSSHEQTVLARAYGMADLEWGIPNSPETIFEGGSLSKQFTSAAVVLLALDGDLSLDDDVRTYIPELPDYGETITIRRLMNHTSGLRDWGSVAALTGWGREQKSHDHGDVLDILSRQTALNYPPGDRYSYTNSGYNLLAMIVDRVSGMPFAQFSEERIFGPLGLAHTQWRDDYRRLVPGRSTAYEVLRDGRVRINRPIEFVHGNGGILTTVGDLLIWDAAATDGRGLGGQAFVDMMEEQGVLNDGSRIVYASGIRLWTMGNLRVVSHTGSTAGYRAFLGRFPDQGLRVAMLCNASNAPTRPSGTAVALAFLADEVRLPQRVASVNVPEAELDRLTGLSANVSPARRGRSPCGAAHCGRASGRNWPHCPTGSSLRPRPPCHPVPRRCASCSMPRAARGPRFASTPGKRSRRSGTRWSVSLPPPIGSRRMSGPTTAPTRP
jgi:CubicO group peptidase (beta-lactamase class C family)